ncbi:TIGR02757 family protein [uncultured Dokdonia sp.]|uniref:TIGR02757 family protein n=1 Tax=uncultured Dokdonia sp. TaxID=575653 RepID=UPI0030EE2835|tara:strand:+ start:45437 stop:46201 length:765 start_codon:yes stop_codon:yes gene_type:complete
MNKKDLKIFLDEKAIQYENGDFIPHDPIQIPHQFELKEDIEIAAFLTATIAWGNRKSIITNATKMMEIMGNAPYDFILNYDPDQAHLFDGFVHRTFNSGDLETFIRALQHIYLKHGGLENTFKKGITSEGLQPAISNFKNLFFEIEHLPRTQKHVSDPLKNSAAKRINMFLRWMVRDANAGVDFGIWKTISPSLLSCPLDVHTSNVARKLKLLTRKQNDGKTLLELDKALRKMDPKDPVKYDFALFGLGAFEKF